MQYNLEWISEKVWNDIEFILDKFGVEYRIQGNRYVGPCFIHNGDNKTALSIQNGRWACFTHNCHKVFGGGMIGFIQGLLSNKEGWPDLDKKVSFKFALNWIISFLKIEDIPKTCYNNVDREFIKTMNVFKERKTNEGSITREQVRSKLKFPASPLILRGFSEQVLNDYDIGLCTEQRKPMTNRAVVPIYDDSHNYMVACLGRSIFEKCPKCNLYHPNKCPTYNLHWFSKWTNSLGFNRGSYLFNYWKAKDQVKKDGILLLVEGALDVIKLEQSGIKNSMAIFGSSITDEQTILLERLPIQKIIVMTDSDKAGKEAAQQIRKQCGHLAPLYFPSFNFKDPGSATEEQLNQVKQYMEKL